MNTYAFNFFFIHLMYVNAFLSCRRSSVFKTLLGHMIKMHSKKHPKLAAASELIYLLESLAFTVEGYLR